jgi:MerR family transcriptional regulator, copper efflux regulator
MGDDLMLIGALASGSGVSRRTVDFYTGMGLLTPVRRSGGNFRLYQPSDVQRIAAIRRLEAQGIRLDEITHLLGDPDVQDHTQCAEGSDGPCPANPVALKAHLATLEAQVRALSDLPESVDLQTRGVMTSLVARAQVLIATAVVLSEEILPVAHLLPHL